MNWQQFTTATTLVLTLVGATWWGSQNIVFAADYHQYQQRQALRWMMYDQNQLWRNYQDVRRIPHKTPTDIERMQQLEHDMKLKRDEINSIRRR